MAAPVFSGRQTATNFKKFSSELKKFVKDRAPGEVNLIIKKISLEALRRIVLRTPVDTGRARGNWQVSLNGSIEESKLIVDKGGAQTINAGLSVISGIRDLGTVHIQNNVSYILTLEEGRFQPPDPGPSRDPRRGRFGRILVKGGYSVQAPRGMVSVTLSELMTIFERAK